MVAPCQRFTHQRILALKFLSFYVHRSTLPQSRFARQLPQRGSREWAGAIQPGTRWNPGLRAIFIAPTKAQKPVPFTIQRTTLPQSALRAASSLREGAGKRSHSTGCLQNRGVAGDFHRPYEGAKSGMGWSKKGASGNVEFPEAPDLRLVRTECPQRLHNPVSRRCTCPASQSSCPR